MEEKTLKNRLGTLFRRNRRLEKVVIMNTGTVDPNFLYMTGFTSGLFEYSYLILDKGGALLITSPLEYETAMAQAVDLIEVVQANSADEMKAFLMKAVSGKIIGINGSFMPYQVYERLKEKYKPKEMLDVSEALEACRLVKDKEEIEHIRKATGITKWAMMLIQKEFKEGMTELELANKFDSMSASLGSEGPSFKTIVCFGKNAALPHHSPDSTKLKYGDIILIDAGAKASNYCSDVTRSFIFGGDGKVEDEDKKEDMLKTVKDAQVKAIRSIKPGLKGKDIDKVARDYIEEAHDGEYKGKFIHSLGHSLGIEVHDGAGFSPGAEQVLKEGMVITAEPGIYINGFGGIRIEDDVLITKDGALVL